MELERRRQCWFCLDPILSRNASLSMSNEDMKMYKDIFESSKKYLNEEEEFIRFSFSWINSDGLLSPLCENCFKSAEIIYGVSKELEEIQENLAILTNKFREDIKFRVSRNRKEKCTSLIKEENEDSIQEENDFIFEDADDEYPLLHSEEEVKFSENMDSSICPSGDDEHFSSALLHSEEEVKFSENMDSSICPSDDDEHFSSGDEDESECILGEFDESDHSTDRHQFDLGSFQLDTDRNIKNMDCEKAANSSRPVMEQRKIRIFPNFERNSSPVIANETTTMYTYQPVYSVTKNESGDFLCDICGRPFKSENWLLTHRPSHNAEHEKPFKCATCGNSFNSQTTLQKHVISHLNESYECYLCKKLFKRRRELKKHLRTHNIYSVDENAFQCSICKRNFKSTNSLKLHVKLHEEQQFQDNCCNKSFESKEQLEQHLLLEHVEPIDKEIKCKACGRLCKDEASLQRHVSRTHTQQSSFPCEICNYKFKAIGTLRRHVQVVHDKILNFKCTTCGKCFGTNGALKKHEKTHEDLSERKKFKCEICEDKYFVNIANLIIHQKQFHTVFTHGYTGENYFVCENCGKTYTNIGHFEIHLRTHTGERPFSCEICGLDFAAKPILKNHLLTHTGEKPHKCTFCEKYFRQSHQLKTHLRIHTGERPYSCSVCGRTFSDRSTWYKHDKRHKQNS